MGSKPEVVNSFTNYAPPVDFTKRIRVLLRYVPREYLSGIDRVTLTHRGRLSRLERRTKIQGRGGRLHRFADTSAYYQQTSKQNPARISVFVDSICDAWTPFVLRLPIAGYCVLAGILYHEIGHHIHVTMQPELGDLETIAEKWKRKLTNKFIDGHYWYMIPFLFIAASLVQVWKCFFKRSRNPRNS